MPEGSTSPRGGRVFVSPPGYFATQFAGSVAMVAGLALAPDGFLLFAAAGIGSVIDTRRASALNPWLFAKDPAKADLRVARVFMKIGLLELAVMFVLAVVGYALVQQDDERIQAIGPALVAGVITLALGYWLRRSLAALGPEPRAGGDRAEEDDDGPGQDPPV